MSHNLFPSSPPPPPPLIVASPEPQFPKPVGCEEAATNNASYNDFTIHRDERQTSMQHLQLTKAKANGMNELHPYVQTLSLSNLESCIALENAIFPENERCSREKFIYRLTTCPELTLGLFSTISSIQDPSSVPTYPTARPLETSDPARKQTLIAMVIAAKTTSPSVTDASMDYPPDYASYSSTSPRPINENRGHMKEGRTICIHTFGVLPVYQKRGLGKALMRSYQQRMETSGIADRIALLAHEHLVGMYKGLGLDDRGKSEVKFGGGGWTSL
ncbi:MAG: hypothetical protein Q9217_006650, partial [Psora testacea]